MCLISNLSHAPSVKAPESHRRQSIRGFIPPPPSPFPPTFLDEAQPNLLQLQYGEWIEPFLLFNSSPVAPLSR
ncbi:hypothetical protein PBY51_013992 [Eleginops maclovinus]|uniref:Uncharacterized protein n=1 Tax=Eleginops maclovinus TaxID=56733 RepID=A0AAN7WKW4_ELEMC|nr:hypothetical protein PBY51_013992 [Eleginops maclovinus]